MADPVSASPDPSSAILPTYARAPVAFVRGEGCWLEASDGSRWLDFGAGIAVACVGHSHPHVVNALVEQGQKLWHVSNLYQIPQAEKLAKRLADATFADYVFFTNSGAEALEGAIKTARKYQYASGHPERVEIITFDNAFHGRTLSTIAAGGNDKYLEGFFAPVEGFHRKVPFGDIAATRAAVNERTAAILVEPIQGEGGIRVPPHNFLRDLRQLCDERGLLLALDEVQCGMGRTGKLFAYMGSGIEPDIMSVAKGIGGGFPLGAFMATKEAAKGMVVGTHGTTYGGNPLATAVGNAVLDLLLAPGFLDNVSRTGLLLKQRLAALADAHPKIIAEIRGEGLMLGLRIHETTPVGDFAVAVRGQHMLVIPAVENVARLLPPLNIGEADIDEAMKRLDRACVELEGGMAARDGGKAGMTSLDAGKSHFLDISEISAADLRRVLVAAGNIKKSRRKGVRAMNRPLDGKLLGMIFDKPSTRTRVSFDVAMRELGGETIMLSGAEMQLGRGETIADTARVLSRYVDAIMIRILDHDDMRTLAENASIPVINGLTKLSHPCQIMADML